MIDVANEWDPLRDDFNRGATLVSTWIAEGNVIPRTATPFVSGGSQAVRLPADCRFAGKKGFVSKDGDRAVLSPKPECWAEFLAHGPKATAAFMQEIEDLSPR